MFKVYISKITVDFFSSAHPPISAWGGPAFGTILGDPIDACPINSPPEYAGQAGHDKGGRLTGTAIKEDNKHIRIHRNSSQIIKDACF